MTPVSAPYSLLKRFETAVAAVLSLALGFGFILAMQRILPDPAPVPTPAPVQEAPPPIEIPPPIPHEEPPPAEVAPLPAEPVRAAPSVPTVTLRSAWQANALRVAPAPGRPMLAVIIDDMGLDRKRSARIIALPGPLTISFMTYASHVAEQADDARQHGHELMMHMPMQPHSEHFDAGPDVLSDHLPPDELRRRVVADLARFDGYVGVNNHMGSRFTENVAGMQIVMEELHKRGLLFIDSMTTGKSVGTAMAHQLGVPAASRDIFIDDSDDEGQIATQLTRAEAQARRSGIAIAIGHPRDHTIAALAQWLPQLAAKGITLVPVTQVVRAVEESPKP